MLDSFLAVAYKHETEKTANRKFVDDLKTLPLEELIGLANGEPSETMKLAFGGCVPTGPGDDCSWIGKFKGSPFFERACQLEQQLLEIEMQEAAQRAQRPPMDDFWQQRDQICVQKRMLDLEFVKAQAASAAPAGGPQELEAVEGAGLDMAQQAHKTEQAQQGKVAADAKDVAVALAHSPGRIADKITGGHKEDASKLQKHISHAAHAPGRIAEHVLGKTAKVLTEGAREHIAPKNFAVSAKQSDTGKPAYPIEDKAHARAALGLVGMHGSPAEKAEVHKDVARKYPGMEGKDKESSSDNPQGAGAPGSYEADPKDTVTTGAKQAADEDPQGHHMRRALLGTGPSAAIEAKPGSRMKALGEGLGHDLKGGLKGLAVGGLGGAALGAAGGALTGQDIKGLAALGGILGGGVGSNVGMMHARHNAEGSEIHGKYASEEVAVKIAFADEMGRRLAQSEQEKTAILDTLLAAGLGHSKARNAGYPEEGAEGALRGAGGYLGGAALGGGLGMHMAEHLNTPVPAVLGALGGGVLGYKALTSKYNKPKEQKKEALDVSGVLGAGKAMLGKGVQLAAQHPKAVLPALGAAGGAAVGAAAGGPGHRMSGAITGGALGGAAGLGGNALMKTPQAQQGAQQLLGRLA